MINKKYMTNTGMIAQVKYDMMGQWSTWVSKPECPASHRLPSADVPERGTAAEAQADLDRLAGRLGWKEVER